MAPAKLRAARMRKVQSKKEKNPKNFLCYREELAVTKDKEQKGTHCVNQKLTPSQISMISQTQHFLQNWSYLARKERRKNGIKEEASQSHPENKIPTNLSGRGKNIPLPIPTTRKTKTKIFKPDHENIPDCQPFDTSTLGQLY